jgi:hypothetical protein
MPKAFAGKAMAFEEACFMKKALPKNASRAKTVLISV